LQLYRKNANRCHCSSLAEGAKMTVRTTEAEHFLEWVRRKKRGAAEKACGVNRKKMESPRSPYGKVEVLFRVGGGGLTTVSCRTARIRSQQRVSRTSAQGQETATSLPNHVRVQKSINKKTPPRSSSKGDIQGEEEQGAASKPPPAREEKLATRKDDCLYGCILPSLHTPMPSVVTGVNI